MNKIAAQIKEIIEQNKSFLISSHKNADPDALCSEIVFAQYLKSIGKKVYIVNNEEVHKRYEFLPYVSAVKSYSDKIKIKPDVAIILDCGEVERIGKVSNLILDSTKVICIDHHKTNNRFGDVNLVDALSSSACEIVFDVLKFFNFKFNDKTATCLYTGIMTDTGGFKFENTSAKTHTVISELMKYKISPYYINHMLYENNPLDDFLTFLKLTKKLRMHFNNKCATILLTKDILDSFSDEFDPRDTIFRFLRSIRGLHVLVIFSYHGNKETRANFRSFNGVDVASIAEQFQGGGHKRASGCMILKDLNGSEKEVLEILGKLFK